jgi:hypothetical protein
MGSDAARIYIIQKAIARKDGKQEAKGRNIDRQDTQRNRHIQLPVLILPGSESMSMNSVPRENKSCTATAALLNRQSKELQ